MITIHVTQEHIDNGAPNDPHKCPVALAVHDTIGRSYIKVEAYLFTIDDSLCFMPFSVRNFMDAYDSGEPVQPFSFPLDY